MYNIACFCKNYKKGRSRNEEEEDYCCPSGILHGLVYRSLQQEQQAFG
jgi:hypothetical protein